MPLIDDSGHRITVAPKAKSKPRPKASSHTPAVGKSYPKPKAMSGLPKWAQEIRNGSDFMPVRVKPISYTAMAKAEGIYGNVYRPTAYQPVTTSTPASQTVTSIGTTYFKPTENVAAGMKKQFNLWQDIKNIGGKVIHKGGSLLMGALDVLSRPRYALMNVFNDKLQQHYAVPNSAGGTDVTGGEVFKGILGMLTPFGTIKDIASGEFDDTIRSAKAGLSGKKKTGALDILNTTNPEFVKAHPLGSSIASIVGDIAFDPVTWLTMGINPGSITKVGASGAKLAMGDRNAAQRLFSETLFTKEGRAAGLNVVKKDIHGKEMGKLERQKARTGRKITRATNKGKTVDPALHAKHQVIKDAIKIKGAEDLKGAELAWKVFRKSLPTAGIVTVSRLNTGAGASSALKGAALLKDLHSDFNWGVAEDLAAEDRWQAMFAANQRKDFVYTVKEDGKKVNKVIEFSKDKTVKDFIFRLSKELNPIASYAEHGTVAARARKSHIVGVESGAKNIQDQFFEHMSDKLSHALTTKESKAYGKISGLAEAKASMKVDADLASDVNLKDSRLLRVSPDNFDDPKMTYEKLRDAARAQWKQGSKGNKTKYAFNEDEAHILYEGVDGVKKIKLSTLKEAAKAEQSARNKRLADKAELGARTATQKSVDQLTGVSDTVAAGRARLIKAGNRIRVGREIHAATKERNAAHVALHWAVAKSIDDSVEFTDAEKVKYHEILRDTNKPIEERIAAILGERSISNVEANEILDDTFHVSVSSDGTLHASAGGNLEDIPKIIQAVIKDRFANRITGSELENAGTTLKTNADGSVQVVQHTPKGEDVVHFQRDVNAELGMMVLDGYRAAAKYAAENDLYQDPEALFDTIHKTTSEFMDMATADSKRQVIQTMYNMTGMRLPEKFVPSHMDVIAQIANKEHKFVNSLTGKPLANQQIPWENLGVRMQTWVTDLFPWAPKVKHSDAARSGLNMEEVKKAVLAKSADWDKPAPDTILDEDLNHFNDLLEKIDVLHTKVSEQPVNGTTGAVNRYNFLDFVLHSEEIIKAQGAPTHVVETGALGKMGRVNTGRLSALDSFTFVDDEAKAGLEALTELKKLSKSGNTQMRTLAQECLAAMFVDVEGMKYIDNLSMPASGSLADANFGEVFSTLGAHARLKESSLRSGKGIQTGHAVQLLDSMWSKVTVNHELQKAFQNAILHNVWVKGQKEDIVAEQMAKEIDKFFAPYANIKKSLYPVKANEGDIKYLKAADKTDEVAQASANLAAAESKLKAAIISAKSEPKLKGTTAEAELKAARDEYVQAMRDHDSAAKPDSPVAVGPDGAQAAPSPEGTPEPPTGVEATPTGDPADFVNDYNTNYTPEEVEAIRKWIGISNTMNNPEEVALQLHAFSNALASDVTLAQQHMISNLADLTIKYGAQVRFMGIPFMPMFNPMNANQTMAGVVAFDQYKGSVNKFYLTVLNKFRSSDRGERAYRYFSRPSKYLEGGLERIRQTTVNSASETRKFLIRELDRMYETALGTKYDSLPLFNGMKRKDKLTHIKKSMFGPEVKGAADPLEQYKLADGTNPVRDIANNFEDSAKEAFTAPDGGSEARFQELSNFNSNMLIDYKLTGGELEAIMDYARRNSAFRDLTPYSREWLREVGTNVLKDPKSKLHISKLTDTNLGKLHYAIQDAKLKWDAGRKLNHGVFEQFAFKMNAATAEMHNKKVVGSTVDANGKPLRGPVVLISKKTIGPSSEWGINLEHIPNEFLDQGYYMPSDILPEINTMFKYMDEVSELNKFINMGYLSKVLSYFKASVTIYKVPTYPVRNLIGDVFMSAFDGLTNPRYYKDAIRLQMDFHQALKRINTANYQEVFDANFLRNETLKGVHDPASVLGPSNMPKTPFNLHLETANGPIQLNGSQVMEAYYKLGLGQNRVAGEIAENAKAARQTWYGVKAGKVHDLLRDTNDVREDWARLSHFLFALEREAPLGGDFEEIIRRAGTRVIKHHFDYNDVSLFERNVLAPWIPFYKWMRNIIPYTIATMVTKPVALKAESATQAIIGHLVDDDQNDNRVDFVMPEWLEYDMPVSIGSFTDANNNEFGQYMSLSMPLSDTLKKTIGPAINPLIDPATQGIGQKALDAGAGAITVGMSSLNPIAKGAIQAATGMEMWPSGPAPEKGNWLETMMTALPGKSNLDSLVSGMKGLEGISGQNFRAWGLEQLGAVNVSNNTESNQLSALKQKEDMYRTQFNAAKTNLSNMIQKRFPNTTPDQRKELVDAIVKESRKSPDSGRLGA